MYPSDLSDPYILIYKSVSLLVLSDSALHLARTGYCAVTGCSPNEGSVGEDMVEGSTVDGLKELSKDCQSARLSNFLYQCMLILPQIAIIGLQNSSGSCLVFLNSLAAVCTIQFVYTTARYKPWNGVMTMLERCFLLLCILVFLACVSLRLVGVYHANMDYGVIIMALLSIVT